MTHLGSIPHLSTAVQVVGQPVDGSGGQVGHGIGVWTSLHSGFTPHLSGFLQAVLQFVAASG